MEDKEIHKTLIEAAAYGFVAGSAGVVLFVVFELLFRLIANALHWFEKIF